MIVNYLAKKNIDFDAVQSLLSESIELNHFSNNGPCKQKLEIFLHSYLGLSDDKAVVCVGSATAALHLLFLFYEKKLGQKLRLASTSYTFPSVVCGNDQKIDLYDIDKGTYNLPLETRLDNYDGYIITNLFGTVPNDIDDWLYFCKNNNKILILDNASSPVTRICSSIPGKNNICNLFDVSLMFSGASIISFHPTKFLGATSEAGAIIIDKNDYIEINSLAGFGFRGSHKYDKFGSNFKMDDVSAAFTLNHIKNYNLKKHLDIQNFFIREINQINGCCIFNYSDKHDIVYGNLPVVFDKPIDYNVFRSLGIETNRYYYPLVDNHINSWDLYNRMVNFPLNSSLTDYQIGFIIQLIKNQV